MATEDRVKVLEGEFKLIKSELRQTLGSVRDFLLDLKLPPMQEEPGTVKEATNTHDSKPETASEPERNPPPTGDNSGFGNNGFGGDGMSPQQDQMPDFSSLGKPSESQSAPVGEPANEEPASEALPPLDFDSDDDSGMSSGDIPEKASGRKEPVVADEEDGEDEESEDELVGDEVSHGKGGSSRSSAPQVNLLANVIRWVSMAKKEIGSAQLPVFLDVYATTGSLSAEMKEIILHLAEVATNPALADETPENGQVISEQLKLCMEINRSSGQLPDEIKLKIQRLTELLLQQSIYYNKADVWSMLLVDLHGILTGGGSSLRSLQSLSQTVIKRIEDCNDLDTEMNMEQEGNDLRPAKFEPDEEENIMYEEPPKTDPNLLKGTRPARLRLILPVGDGQEQELDLGNLFIATDGKGKQDNGHKKSTSIRK
jgi:hypothetical protein